MWPTPGKLTQEGAFTKMLCILEALADPPELSMPRLDLARGYLAGFVVAQDFYVAALVGELLQSGF